MRRISTHGKGIGFPKLEAMKERAASSPLEVLQ
jgi:hypothetical protein